MRRIARKSFVGVVGVCVIVGAFTIAAYATKSTNAFIHAATIGNQFEISSSRLALQNSHNDTLKQFAQEMIDDHTQVANDMKQTLPSSGLVKDQSTPALDASHQKMVDKLNSLSGEDFDKQYVKMQVKAHDDAVSLFRDYSKNGDNDALKAFAAKELPTLEQHQKAIHDIQASF